MASYHVGVQLQKQPIMPDFEEDAEDVADRSVRETQLLQIKLEASEDPEVFLVIS